MHDIKLIRDNPEWFDMQLQKRGIEALSATIIVADRNYRAAVTEQQRITARRNDISKNIGYLKGKGQDSDHLSVEISELKAKQSVLEVQEKNLESELHNLLSAIPNHLDDEVPEGDEENNQVVRYWGSPKASGVEHFIIGEKLGMMDFDSAARMSGSRFVLLKGHLARLERALAAFMLDTHTVEFGYTEVSPPLMVRDHALFGTGQLPKFGDDMFVTNHNNWLISTSEIVLTNLVRETILEANSLPLRFTACTPCFRSEAGAAGRDTRGMLRQHQFLKVELVSITSPQESKAEHLRMLNCAETILERLKLPYRTVLLAAKDTGFCSQKTYDLEVWLPGQGKYREVSSCSNCSDFQARRMNARMRIDGKNHYVHTLNGSGLAVGRTLIAVLENYVQIDGSVAIPEVLISYMGGIDKIALPS